ncbi:metal-sulfur cluster assembly factor, partial [candidate division KSB1 bacterium]
VWDALNQCFDPEIPIVTIVELGLIYDVSINGSNVDVKMTLTARGCGMAKYIAADAKSKIETIDGIGEVNVEIVWDPPWTPERISESAKKKLGYQ